MNNIIFPQNQYGYLIPSKMVSFASKSASIRSKLEENNKINPPFEDVFLVVDRISIFKARRTAW